MHDEATRRAYPFLDRLEAHFDEIREEALGLDPALWVDMPEYPNLTLFVLNTGIWGDGYPGLDLEANRARCPRTAAVLDAIGGVEMVGFMCMPPGVTMRRHTDPRDDDLVRCHLGLVLPPNEQAWWPEGKARLMDPRQPHWGRNDSERRRLTLQLDVRMPFVVPENAWGPWRPDDPPASSV
ncbi:MAG: aspartyl/asparaginyl beta-hydroxylase domain-containing protein [Sandaracinaceae bacterium]